MSDAKESSESEARTEHERGGALVCGKCRVKLGWDPLDEHYSCPKCGWLR